MEEIREAQSLTDEEKRILYEWGENIFGVEEHKFRWRPKDLHFLLYDDGKPLSHVGILKHVISVNGEPATVAGVGGVVTVPEAQGKGHACRLLQHAAEFFEREWNVDAGLLFCRPELMAYYEALGWKEFVGPVLIEQTDGNIASPLCVMTLPLTERNWAAGNIELRSFPW